MTPLEVALVAIMVSAAPPRLANLPAWPGWAETPEQRQERYEAIASAAARVALDPAERALWSGRVGRFRTAAALLATAFHESGFAPDVDAGPCYQGSGAARGRCDGGASACLMQIKVGTGTTAEGWTREELFADREKCFRAGLHKLRVARCGSNAPDQLWAGWWGSCEPAPYAPALGATIRVWTTADGLRVALATEAASGASARSLAP